MQVPSINSYSSIVAKSLKEYKERKELETYNVIVDNAFFPVQEDFSLYSDDAFVSSNQPFRWFCSGISDRFQCMITGSLEIREQFLQGII